MAQTPAGASAAAKGPTRASSCSPARAAAPFTRRRLKRRPTPSYPPDRSQAQRAARSAIRRRQDGARGNRRAGAQHRRGKWTS
ncbi:MAG: hypothetical protein ACLTMP_01535 [Eggerthella lenta]